MNSFIFDKFSEIKPKEYSYDFSKSNEQMHWDIYYRHRFKMNGRTYYATMLGNQDYPTAYIAFDTNSMDTTKCIEDNCYYYNNGNFTQDFSYYEERNNKIILGWDYAHLHDYRFNNLTGKKHTTKSVIADIKQTIKEIDDFLFTYAQRNEKKK